MPTQIHGNSEAGDRLDDPPGAHPRSPIAVFTVATIFDLAKKPDDALDVEVIGQQWWWEFKYDVHDGKGIDHRRTSW